MLFVFAYRAKRNLTPIYRQKQSFPPDTYQVLSRKALLNKVVAVSRSGVGWLEETTFS